MGNYSAIVYKITNTRPHSNADRLNCSNIFTNNVIIGKDIKEGDIGVFFPVECQLSKEFCLANDLIRRKDENGKSCGGMLEENRRIKCISLRGEKSMGFWCPMVYMERWAAICGFELPFLKENQEIDSLFGFELCRKYEVISQKSGRQNRSPKEVKNQLSLVSGQFNFHFDTSPLWKNGDKLNRNDIVSISNKLHGSLFSVANVLVKRKFTFVEKIAKFFGVKVQEMEYREIAASRKVLKTENPRLGYYGEDVWTFVLENTFKGRLKQGETIHGEIVNQTPSEKWIQKDYSYGFPEKTIGIFIYRILQTSPCGNSVELSWPQMKARCLELGVPHVPELFYGKLEDVFPSIDYSDREWQKIFVEKFYEKYAPDIACPMCNNGVPQEGAVLRVEGKEIANYKAKSSLFLCRESKELDSGYCGIEEGQNSEEKTL